MSQIRRRPKDRPKTAEDAAQQEKQLLLDYRATFRTDAGQRVLADILRRCEVMQSTFRPGHPDMTAYLEGRRRVGLELIETINRDPDAMLRLAGTGETQELFDA